MSTKLLDWQKELHRIWPKIILWDYIEIPAGRQVRIGVPLYEFDEWVPFDPDAASFIKIIREEIVKNLQNVINYNLQENERMREMMNRAKAEIDEALAKVGGV